MAFELTSTVYAFWISSFFYILATIYLTGKIKQKHLGLLIPLSVYLGAIAVMFFLKGLNAATGLSLVNFAGAIAVIIGSAYITRFPLKLQYPEKEELIYYILLIIGLLLAAGTYVLATPETFDRIVNLYAFLLAGVVTMGYIIYQGIRAQQKTAKVKSIGTGVSMGLCCVAAHGIVAFQILPSVGFPFLGVFTAKLPFLFALASPIALILVLFVGSKLNEKPTKKRKRKK